MYQRTQRPENLLDRSKRASGLLNLRLDFVQEKQSNDTRAGGNRTGATRQSRIIYPFGGVSFARLSSPLLFQPPVASSEGWFNGWLCDPSPQP